MISSNTKGGEEDIVVPVADAAVLVAENSITTSKKKKKKKKKKEDAAVLVADNSITTSTKKKKKKKETKPEDLMESNTISNIPIISGHSGSSSSKKRKNKKKKDSDDIDVDATNNDMVGGSNTSNSLPTTSGHSGSGNSSVKKRKKKKKNSNTNSADISSDPSSTIVTVSETKIVSSITTKGREDVIAIPVADSVIVPVVAEPVVQVNEVNAFQVPAGGPWKNTLLSCCSACLCPCLMGGCCFPILLGQVVERLKYNTCGTTSSDGNKSWPVCWIFMILWIIVISVEIIAFYFYSSTFICAMTPCNHDDDYYDDDNNNFVLYNYTSYTLSYQILLIVMGVCVWFLYFISCCTRMKMRKQYQIEPTCCGDNCCDDCCISMYCTCCSIVQMARHTHDEDTYPYHMTSRTGLGPDAPEIF